MERDAAKAIADDMENKVIGGAYAAVLLRRHCGLDDTKEDLGEVAVLVATLRNELAETRRKLEEAEKRIQQLGELPIGEFIEKDGEITLEVMVEACRFNAYAEDLAGAILHRPKKGGAS